MYNKRRNLLNSPRNYLPLVCCVYCQFDVPNTIRQRISIEIKMDKKSLREKTSLTIFDVYIQQKRVGFKKPNMAYKLYK